MSGLPREEELQKSAGGKPCLIIRVNACEPDLRRGAFLLCLWKTEDAGWGLIAINPSPSRWLETHPCKFSCQEGGSCQEGAPRTPRLLRGRRTALVRKELALARDENFSSGIWLMFHNGRLDR